MIFALDTNTLIYFFKGMGRVKSRLLEQTPLRIAIPSVVVFELEVGIAKSTDPDKRRGQLTELLRVTRVIPLGASEAREAANIRADLESRGQPIGPFDVLIAGTARAHAATLVTHNTAEFERVPGLHCVDWF